ncbi:MAG: PEP-CTERM sorting domain-containing protein [Verrucomicrobiota bacterium]
MSSENEIGGHVREAVRSQQVLFAETPAGVTIGVVSESEPSSLALLAAGVAGIGARRARRAERMKSQQAAKTES